VKGGLRLRSREGAVAGSPLARAWVERLERWVADEALRDGLEYARIGQVLTLEGRRGGLDATVQGRAARPYRANLDLPPFDETQWQLIISAMAGEAAFEARLLRGQIPPEIDRLLQTLGLSMLPEPSTLSARCECGATMPCKHIAAAGWLLAERLDAEPLLILSLRGLGPAALLERLRQARLMQAGGVTAAHRDPAIPESRRPPRPLEECLDDFWRCGPELAELEHLPPPEHAPHALLRRLGPSPLKGRFPIVGLLASVYDTVAQHALRLRDRAEQAGSDASPPRSGAA
jgi:uncharacterized Zn finger protein